VGRPRGHRQGGRYRHRAGFEGLAQHGRTGVRRRTNEALQPVDSLRARARTARLSDIGMCPAKRRDDYRAVATSRDPRSLRTIRSPTLSSSRSTPGPRERLLLTNIDSAPCWPTGRLLGGPASRPENRGLSPERRHRGPATLPHRIAGATLLPGDGGSHGRPAETSPMTSLVPSRAFPGCRSWAASQLARRVPISRPQYRVARQQRHQTPDLAVQK